MNKETKDQVLLVIAILVLFLASFITWTPLSWIVLIGVIGFLLMWYTRGYHDHGK
ncbi:MAG TPA: hypothetical protein VG935_02435 [Patescibacteria group bacterium]|nr:hypothetical protein [Patescibacteria group bacterium]